MMEEKTYRFKINKNDGCKRFRRIRKMIEENEPTKWQNHEW